MTVNHVATDWLPWVAFAAIAIPAKALEAAPDVHRERRRRRARRGAPSPALPRLIGRVAITAGLAVAALQFVPLQAAHAAESARRARAEGAYETAILAAQRAVSQDPGHDDYWHQLALSYAAADELPAAIAALQRASEAAPYDFKHPVNLARTQLRVATGAGGDARALADALQTARRAAALDPYVDEVQYTLALVAARSGRDDEATAAAELWSRLAGAKIDDFVAADGPLICEATGSAYASLGRPSDAERWLRLCDRRSE